MSFTWSMTRKRVQHSRNSLTFEKGNLVKKSSTAESNIVTLSGLSYEEFMKFYREAEKTVEDFLARKRLADMGAEEFLWQPVRSELYPKAIADVAAEAVNAIEVKQEDI